MDGSKSKALIGTIAVHIALVAGLIFSVRWKHVENTPVAVELVTRASTAAPPTTPST